MKFIVGNLRSGPGGGAMTTRVVSVDAGDVRVPLSLALDDFRPVADVLTPRAAPDIPRRAVTGRADRIATCRHRPAVHLTDPAQIRGGRYPAPQAPGLSSTMRPDSRARFAYPDGPIWTTAPTPLRKRIWTPDDAPRSAWR